MPLESIGVLSCRARSALACTGPFGLSGDGSRVPSDLNLPLFAFVVERLDNPRSIFDFACGRISDRRRLLVKGSEKLGKPVELFRPIVADRSSCSDTKRLVGVGTFSGAQQPVQVDIDDFPDSLEVPLNFGASLAIPLAIDQPICQITEIALDRVFHLSTFDWRRRNLTGLHRSRLPQLRNCLRLLPGGPELIHSRRMLLVVHLLAKKRT